MRRFVLVKSFAGAAALAATLAVAPLGAQSFRGRGNDEVPEGHRPPPGMCRIWIDGVPPGQQPAPTDCATAVRNRPANGRVIFGDDAAKSGKGKPRKFSGGSYSAGDDDRAARGDDRGDDRDDDADRAERGEHAEHREHAERGEHGERAERGDREDRRDDDADRARHRRDDSRSDGERRRDSRRKPN